MTHSLGTETWGERMKRPGNWRLADSLPGGHRIFLSTDTSLGLRWAIADDSGATPPETDDGVLLLDPCPERPLTVRYDDAGALCSVPLLTLDGLLTRTLCDTTELMLLAAKFQWRVHVRTKGGRQHTYEVKEITP